VDASDGPCRRGRGDDAATGNISIRTVERSKIPRRAGGKVI
jgi:hypothetical protein